MTNRIRRGQCVLLMIGVATSLSASELTVPHTFTSGTTAVAAQVNANFQATRIAVNDNHARINQLLAQVQALATTVSALQNQLDAVQDSSAGSNIAMGYLNHAVPALQQVRTRPGVTLVATHPQPGRVDLQILGADTAQIPITMVTTHAAGGEFPSCNTRLLLNSGPADYTVRIDCQNAAGVAQNTSFQFLIAD